MTVYEMIQKLAQLPPDMPVHIMRSGQARKQRPLSFIRNDIGARGRTSYPYTVTLLTDWEREDA